MKSWRLKPQILIASLSHWFYLQYDHALTISLHQLSATEVKLYTPGMNYCPNSFPSTLFDPKLFQAVLNHPKLSLAKLTKTPMTLCMSHVCPNSKMGQTELCLGVQSFPLGVSTVSHASPSLCHTWDSLLPWWDGPKSIPTHSHLLLAGPNLGCCLGRHDKQVVTLQDLSQLTPISLCLISTLGLSWEDMTSRLWHFKICPNSLPSLSAWSQPWMCLGKTWQAIYDISRSVPTHSHLSLPDLKLGSVLGRHDKQVVTFQDLTQLGPIFIYLVSRLHCSYLQSCKLVI